MRSTLVTVLLALTVSMTVPVFAGTRIVGRPKRAVSENQETYTMSSNDKNSKNSFSMNQRLSDADQIVVDVPYDETDQIIDDGIGKHPTGLVVDPRIEYPEYVDFIEKKKDYKNPTDQNDNDIDKDEDSDEDINDSDDSDETDADEQDDDAEDVEDNENTEKGRIFKETYISIPGVDDTVTLSYPMDLTYTGKSLKKEILSDLDLSGENDNLDYEIKLGRIKRCRHAGTAVITSLKVKVFNNDIFDKTVTVKCNVLVPISAKKLTTEDVDGSSVQTTNGQFKSCKIELIDDNGNIKTKKITSKTAAFNSKRTAIVFNGDYSGYAILDEVKGTVSDDDIDDIDDMDK